MSFIDNLKEKTQESQHDKGRKRFSAVDAPKFLKKEDGSWNKTSIALSGLTLALVLGLGAYSIVNFQTKGSLIDDVIYGLSTEDAQKAVTEAFLTSINQYLDGEITEDQLREALANLVHDYITKSSAFTDEQKAELDEIISNYLQTVGIEDLIKSSKTIEHINKEIERRFNENEHTREMLLHSIETEIQNNKNYTQEQLDMLNELHDKLEKLELTHWNSINNMLSETIQRYDHYTEELQANSYGGLQVWKAGAEYKINTLVIYNIGADYDNPNGVIGAQNDVRIYKNLTGNNTDVAPNKDTTNWQQMSLGEAIQNIYNITTGDIAAFDEWVKNHETNSDGSVIDQYVTYNNNIYQNITGEYDPNKTPDQDKTNWEQLSIMQALEKNLQKTITDIQGDMASYKEWLENHKTDADGSVIHQYVTYHNEVYQNITGEYDPSKTPDKDPTNWEKVSVFDAIEKNLQEMIDNMYKDLSSYTDWLENHKTNAGGDVINQYVTYEEKLYQNISGEYDPSKTPDQDPTNWKEVSLGEAIQNVYNTYVTDTFGDTAGWSADAEYKIDDYVIYKNKIYRNITGEYTSTNPAEDKANWKEASVYGEINNNYNIYLKGMYGDAAEWSSSAEYKIDDYVIYKNKIYRNVTGEYTSTNPAKDTANWKEASAFGEINYNYNTYLTGMYGDAAEWSADAEYKIDNYVIYKNKIYRNITGEYTSTNPAEDTTNWREASAFGEINNNYQTFLERLYGGINEWVANGSYKPNSYVMYKNQLYRNITGTNTDITPDEDKVNWEASSMVTVIQNTYNTFLSATGAKDYVASESHSAGDYVIYNNTIYKNVSDNPAAQGASSIPGVTDGDGTESVWVSVTLTDMIDQNYQTFIKTVGAEDYNNGNNYQAGDYVIKDGVLYRATDATSGAFDASKWEKVTITDQIDTLRTDLDALAVKSSADLETVNKNLTDTINKNKSLSEEQRQQMLQIINNNADASAKGMDKLRTDLTSVINSNDTKNTKEREKLLEQLNALSDNTATHMDDYEKRIKDLEKRTTSTDGGTKFQFESKNGVHGYVVNGRFYPL